MAAKTDDLLEGITAKTTKEELLGRLRDAAKKLAGHQDENVARLQSIEKRVRNKAKPGTNQKLLKVIVGSTEAEWKESIAWLEEWEEFLPVALDRLLEGGKTLLKDKQA